MIRVIFICVFFFFFDVSYGLKEQQQAGPNDMDHGVSQNKDIQTLLIHFQTSLTRTI